MATKNGEKLAHTIASGDPTHCANVTFPFSQNACTTSNSAATAAHAVNALDERWRNPQATIIPKPAAAVVITNIAIRKLIGGSCIGSNSFCGNQVD
ncbi:MAG: hypothetical protein ACTHLN_02940 [Tepidisphaeraceae bacterium]